MQPVYEIDPRWKIVKANETFCRAFRCTESGVIGRDLRDLLREDWRLDFRAYVARALIGAGELDVTLPMVAPCGEHSWYKHSLEPLMHQGVPAGYRATIQPHIVVTAEPVKRWWEWRPTVTRQVWDFEPGQLAHAS